jgi:hypothetical protein
MRRVFPLYFLLTLFFLIASPLFTTAKAETVDIKIQKRWDLPSLGEQEEALRDCRGDVDEGLCQERITLKQIGTDIPSSLSCALGGVVCGAKNETEAKYYMNKSVLAQGTQLITFLYTQPPASTSEFLAYTFNKAGLIPKTYAQGITYSRLLPILPIWRAFRDIAYILLSIVMLFIGLMIMLRSKVNPQTIANVENTIPKLIVTMVLIAFSFPIASLIIDFMYVLIAAGIGVIGNIDEISDPNVTKAIADFTTGGLGVLIKRTLAPALEFSNVGTAVGGTIGVGGAAIAGIAGISGIGLLAFPIIGLIAAGISGTTADGGNFLINALSPVFVLLILIVLFFNIFKIFFMLLNAYIQILINIILSPLILLVNAVPGQNTLSNWIKGLLANMLTFVVTAVMLYLAYGIASLVQNQNFWVPPMLVQSGIPQISIGLISLGIVLLIPQVVAKVKGLFGTKPMFNVGPSMLTQPITSSATQGMGLAGQFHTTAQFAKPLLDKFKGKG